MSPDRPNVLWIFCDELRADAVAAYGNAHAAIRTPHIDRIAAAGTRFERCYVNSPVCVSSRAAYKTGLLPTRSGVYHNEGSFLPVRVGDSFVEQFRAAGYTAVNFGKEHVPAELEGFERSTADGAEQMELMAAVGERAATLGLTAFAIGLHAATWPPDDPFPPERLAGHAVRWLRDDRPRSEPWLLRVSFLQPHTPVVVPEPWASKYDTQSWPDVFGPDDHLSQYERAFAAAAGSGDLTPEQIMATQSRYHGLVAWIDTQVGRLLDALADEGLDANTIVVFSSDHGAQLGELGGAYGKMTFARPSHHVPFMVAWPGAIPAGAERDDLAQGVDLGPTLLDLAGLDVPPGLDGRRLFRDPAPPAMLSAIGYGNPGGKPLPMVDRGEFPGGFGWPQRLCVRTDRWRYERSTRRDGLNLEAHDWDPFLVDCEADPQEVHNLAGNAHHATVEAELEAMLAGHFEDAVQVDPDVYAEWPSGFERMLVRKWGSP